MAKKSIEVETLTHDATRKNIPTAEFESIMREQDKTPIQLAYERRNADLDPQLVWRGKDVADWSDLIVQAPPLYIQEKVHPKVIIDDLKRESANRAKAAKDALQFDMFADFNGLPDAEAATEFYQHDQHWSNRMISGDSLSVMASLAEREGLRGQVQCIYFDPPYGIKFNSNFQWSTTSRDVKDGDKTHVTREPEQVRAFRDTWKDGIHSYLTYLRDRLTVARDLLSESGSIFVQIGDENVHRVRALMDEVFGEKNFVNTIVFKKKSSTLVTETVFDLIVWYCRNSEKIKVRTLYEPRSEPDEETKFNTVIMPDTTFLNVARSTDGEISDLLATGGEWARVNYPIVSQHPSETRSGNFNFRGLPKECGPNKQWRFGPDDGLPRLVKANRVFDGGGRSLGGVTYWKDWNHVGMSNIWSDFHGEKFPTYVVQTAVTAVQRCILMTTDPGDLVLDPTCGSGTTAYVAEQWGRRWITIDTSRVAIALARSRLMGARYPFYLLVDSPEGQHKEAEVTRSVPKSAPTHGSIRQGFVYDRVPHITLKSIADNAEIDVIWERMQPAVEQALHELNGEMQGFSCPHPIATGGRAGQAIDFCSRDDVKLPSGQVAAVAEFLEWEVPREPGTPMSGKVLRLWNEARKSLHELERLEKLLIKPKAPVGDEKVASAALRFSGNLESLNDLLEEDRDRPRHQHYFQRENLLGNIDLDGNPVLPWPRAAQAALARFWDARIARQREIDASIAAKADFEYLYDKPFADNSKVRVAGPFTVESLSPHRTLAVDWDDELIDLTEAAEGKRARGGEDGADFVQMILENLRAAGVQQAHKEDRITFTAIKPWPGRYIAAEGLFMEADRQRRAGVFIGPEFGTVSRPDLVAAAREAGDAGFDMLIACAFNYDAHSAEFDKLGRVPVLKARMNPDLHMAGDLKATGAGNLFVVFGEPDIRIDEADGMLTVQVFGVDVFKPQTGEVQSEGTDGIALWLLDTDYNEESFFVRHAYFLGANDPYKALKTTLKAEIDEDAWESLYSDKSRPFPKPKSGRIAVKVINHLGDEVMKVFAVDDRNGR